MAPNAGLPAEWAASLAAKIVRAQIAPVFTLKGSQGGYLAFTYPVIYAEHSNLIEMCYEQNMVIFALEKKMALLRKTCTICFSLLTY